MAPETRYATSDEISIAYQVVDQVVGDYGRTLVLVPGFVSHLDLMWENASMSRMLKRLSKFARLVMFDKRGTGLSDRVAEIATLEQRMDDVRAVMDATGTATAGLLGWSEGAPMSILFAATYPDRCTSLSLVGGMARGTADDDYPWAAPPEAFAEASEFIGPHWGQGASIEIFTPSLSEDVRMREWYGKVERQGASPGALGVLQQMFLQIDVRPVLPTISVPTLIMHRVGDRVINVRAARWMAEQIPGARYVELPGTDHAPYGEGSELIVGEIEEFITGARGKVDTDRILATCLFTDIVDSTKQASVMGDRKWHDLLDAHNSQVRKELERFRGKEIKATGDGFLATFDGPARAIRCAQAITEGAKGLGIEIRAGIHTGECEVVGDDVAGITVHIAARVGAMARGGEVLISRTVKDLVAGSGLAFANRGVHELKGVPDDWQLYALEGDEA